MVLTIPLPQALPHIVYVRRSIIGVPRYLPGSVVTEIHLLGDTNLSDATASVQALVMRYYCRLQEYRHCFSLRTLEELNGSLKLQYVFPGEIRKLLDLCLPVIVKTLVIAL